MVQRTTYWYVQPTADLTNEALSDMLRISDLASGSETTITVNGVKLEVYEVKYRFITMLEHSAAHRKHFTVYVKEGGGEARRWNLQGRTKNKGRKTKKYRDAEEKLKQLKK